MSQTLGRSTASGLLWLLLQGLSGRLGSFLSQLVLAKILLPEAFGAIGLAYTVTTLVNAFVSFGIDDILLQRLRTMYLWVSPAFWTSLGGAVIGMTLMLVAAPFAARIYGNPNLIGLVAVLAISLPISAFSTIPVVKLRGALNFRFLGIYATIETLSMQLATVLFAAAGFGAYSFVIPLPLAAFVKVCVFWSRSPTRIRMRFHRVQFLHIISSSFLVQATRLVVEAVNQGDYIVLGLLANDATVGIYFFAFRLAAQPLQMLAGNFGAVLFPALTQLRSEPARQEAAALRAARILAYVVTPVCFLQAALAAPVLHLMFGVKWNGAIPLVQILSLGLPGDATSWIAGALLVARRQFKRDLFYLAGSAIPFFAMVTTGALLGSAVGVAIAVSLYYALIKPINSWLVFRDQMRLADFMQIFVQPPAIAGAALGCAYLTAQLWLATHPLEQLVWIGTLGMLAYLGLLRLFMPNIVIEVLEQVPGAALLRRFARRAPP